MRDVQFMVLTGHLDDHPLPSLIKTLYGQHKSGRLHVEYAEAPAAFYFEQGKLVDASLGDLRGLEALLLALSLPGASFNFNPLVKPPERTFPEREQNFIRDLLEASTGNTQAVELSQSDAGPLQIVYDDDSAPPAIQAQLALPPPAEEHLVSEVRQLLAVHSRRFSRERAVYAGIIAALLLFAIGSRLLGGSANAPPTGQVPTRQTVPEMAPGEPAKAVAAKESSADVVPGQPAAAGAPTQPSGSAAASTARIERRSRKSKPAVANTNAAPSASAIESSPTASAEQTVSVLMQVDGGRVVQARVQNSRPGMASYEALALRLARQRRYPEGFSGHDTLQLRVKP